MPRGCLSQRKNLDGTTTFYALVYGPDGKRIKRAVGSDRRSAEHGLTALLSEIDAGKLRAPARDTLESYANAWLERRRPHLEAASRAYYEAHVRLRIAPHLGHKKLGDITRGDVQALVAALHAKHKWSAKTINDATRLLHAILADAQHDGLIPANPAQSRRGDLLLPRQRPPLRVLDATEARDYIAACADWFEPLARLLLGTGMRLGEAIALEWSDVDLDGAVITVSRSSKLVAKGDSYTTGVGGTKSDRVRSVAIDSALVATLREHRRESGRIAGLVFTHNGAPLYRQQVFRAHKAALKAAGLPSSVRVHDLRHSAASAWLSGGESLVWTSRQLGHASVAITGDVYAHVVPQESRQAAERAGVWLRADSS
jgi:integrase